jgi:hypothetical protein
MAPRVRVSADFSQQRLHNRGQFAEDPTWLNLAFKSVGDSGEDVAGNRVPSHATRQAGTVGSNAVPPSVI